jgi:hypothetical protein
VKRTFVDADVLIAAARGGDVQAARAMEILDDPEREFAAAFSCGSRFFRKLSSTSESLKQPSMTPSSRR